MAKEDLSKLGFRPKKESKPKAEGGRARKRAQEGFISGVR